MRARPGVVAAWGPVAIWCGVIFLLSSLSPEGEPRAVPHADKAVHFVEYGVLGFLLVRALLANRPQRSRRSAVAAAAVLAVLYGVSDELHQILVPGRVMEWGDLAADLLGALAGSFLRVRLAPRPLPAPAA